MLRSCFGSLLVFSLSVLCLTAAEPPDAQKQITSAGEASRDAQLSTARIKLQPEMTAELYASEPLLANPVAFCFDNKGQIYVAETYRIHAGVTDNRSHMYWLDDDIACNTVADRDAKYRKHLKEKYKTHEKERDQIRLLVDSQGKGKPDKSYVFSDNYRRAMDGIGSGVLVHQGNVYYTCIPDLWLLKDTKGTHQADVQQSLSTGYGVHTSFIGHDLHGLVVSPVDGKLYYSIGDRGANIVTKEGKKIEVPHCGAVFRCNPDGSDLELFAKGLRNPQELVFDDYGNLFTGDNNSDSGDKARFVYLPEGADCGWHIGWQYLEQPYPRGSWNAEYMWHPPRQDQPAFIVPPITNLGDGPSGLTYYPGTGLPDRYKNHFFLADFRGSPQGSGIRSFALKPKGAGFELIDSQQFAWNVLATDVEFGPDGALYVLDWVEGWGKTGKGRIHRISSLAGGGDAPLSSGGRGAGGTGNATAKEVQSLLAGSWYNITIQELIGLLGHADRRVRMKAQEALIKHPHQIPAKLACCAILKESKNEMLRLHAIWALNQFIAPIASETASAFQSVLQDNQAPLVVNVLRVCAKPDPILKFTAEDFNQFLFHQNAHVRAQAAQCVGKQGCVEALPALLKYIESAKDDPWLRHAGTQGLAGLLQKDPTLASKLNHADQPGAVRLATSVAARRLGLETLLISFLQEKDSSVLAETIRAIHDEPGLLQAKAALSRLPITSTLNEQNQLRLLNARLHQGDARSAQEMVDYAKNSAMPEKVRIQAVKMLGVWANPPGRDWVTGLWRPIAARSATFAEEALRNLFPYLLTDSPKVLVQAIRTAQQLKLQSLTHSIALLATSSKSPEVRLAALQASATLQAQGLDKITLQLLRDSNAEVRKAAQGVLVKLDPQHAVATLVEVLNTSQLRERQAAFGLLASLHSAAADEVLEKWLNRFTQGDVPGELQLDLIQAIEKRNRPRWKDKLTVGLVHLKKQGPYPDYRAALLGGDAQAGRQVFFEKTAVACLRCHKVGKDGGEVGPDLSKIGKEKSREYLLESIVDPNKTIAKNFELSIILTSDGVIHQGVVKSEDETTVKLITPEAKTEILKKADIEDRKTGKSAMPEDILKQLSREELRSLIEYLAELK